MDESHDQSSMCKTMKKWSKTCVFCCEKYPIPIIILILFFLLYLFFPLACTYLIYSSPLVGFSLLVHKLFFGNNLQKVKHVEQEDRRKKFAKSRRSFKSVYSDRNQRLVRRNTLNKGDDCVDMNDDDNDDIFVKSLIDLLEEKKSKDVQEVKFESIAGKGDDDQCSSSNVNCNIDNDDSEQNGKPQDYKVVRWAEDDQKNETDLGLLEAERNKRLESLMVRRRSRKHLGYEEKGSSTGNNNNVPIPAVKTTKINPFLEVKTTKINPFLEVKTTKINPFLEDKSDGKMSPGSAPSSLLTTSNPFDIPYDPHEEKLDLRDNFHEEFTAGQPKDPVFCRHQSFSLGAFSHSVFAHDKHETSRYKDKSVVGDENKHIQQDSPVSDDSIDGNHPNEEGASSKRAVGDLDEDETEIKEIDSFDERKADINFFYGSNKRGYHAASNSIVSDMQVELSDEGTDPSVDDLDIEKDRGSLLNPSRTLTSDPSDNVLNQDQNIRQL